MGDCEIENCKCCKEREHTWKQYGIKKEKLEKAAEALNFYAENIPLI